MSPGCTRSTSALRLALWLLQAEASAAMALAIPHLRAAFLSQDPYLLQSKSFIARTRVSKFALPLSCPSSLPLGPAFDGSGRWRPSRKSPLDSLRLRLATLSSLPPFSHFLTSSIRSARAGLAGTVLKRASKVGFTAQIPERIPFTATWQGDRCGHHARVGRIIGERVARQATTVFMSLENPYSRHFCSDVPLHQRAVDQDQALRDSYGFRVPTATTPWRRTTTSAQQSLARFLLPKWDMLPTGPI